MSEYICQISLFSQSHVSQKWSICLYYDTTLHLLWSKRSSLWSDNIACNWKDSFTFTACHWDCKDNPDQKSKKRKCFLVVLPPIQLVNVWGSIWDNLFICWALILEPSCGCGGDDDNDKDWWKSCDLTSTQSRNKNPEKSRRNFWTIPGLKIRVNPVPKNPGIPGFGKIPSRKIPGLKILIPLGPAGECIVVTTGIKPRSQSPVHLFQPCAGGSTDLGLYLWGNWPTVQGLPPSVDGGCAPPGGWVRPPLQHVHPPGGALFTVPGQWVSLRDQDTWPPTRRGTFHCPWVVGGHQAAESSYWYCHVSLNY